MANECLLGASGVRTGVNDESVAHFMDGDPATHRRKDAEYAVLLEIVDIEGAG